MKRNHIPLVLLALAPVFVADQSDAQDPATFSSDVTVALEGNAFEDQEVVTDNQLGTVTMAPLGALPEASDVNAYHLLADGDQLYSLDTTAELGGGLIASPADVVRYDGLADTLEFDASAEGIPVGVIVDAVSVHSSGDLVLSFDVTVDLGSLTANDEDAVRFDGSAFSLLFDGSSQGVPEGLDLDGLDVLPSGSLLWVSFDGSGVLGGVNFDDEDILEFDPNGSTWSLIYDGSALHADLVAADVVAVTSRTTASATPTTTPSATPTATPTGTAGATPSATPSATPTAAPTPTATPTPTDSDGDGVPDATDNCITTPNPDQDDSDGDLCGNHCDADYNQDSLVSILDFGTFRNCFIAAVEWDCDHAPEVLDGVISIQDFGVFRQQFLAGAPGPGQSAACDGL